MSVAAPTRAAGSKTVSRTGRFRLTPKEWHNLRLGLFFISPWLIGFFGFLLYPIIYTVQISFTHYTGFGTPEWIGLDNFTRMLSDNVFWTSLFNTLYYTALAVPIGVIVAITLALAMNQPLREIPLYRAALYLPSVLPLFAVSLIFIALLDPTHGLLNGLLIAVGLPSPNWFGDPKYAKIGLVIMAQIGAGSAALIFLAGLKGIPISLYEAAELDGASSWRKFWSVTVPMITPIILYNLILGMSGGLQVFQQAYIISNGTGSPANSTLFYVLYLYQNAFRYSDMGYASAMAWILFIITFVISILVFRWSQSWVYYE